MRSHGIARSSPIEALDNDDGDFFGRIRQPSYSEIPSNLTLHHLAPGPVHRDVAPRYVRSNGMQSLSFLNEHLLTETGARSFQNDPASMRHPLECICVCSSDGD
jgi:hypothetical protein